MAAVVDSKDARGKVVYEESQRALSQQELVLDNLRSRTGVLLAATAISSTFLGGQALGGGKLGVLSLLAILAFAVVGWFCLRVLWPRGEWNFSHNVAGLVDAYIDDSHLVDTAEEMQILLALENQKFYDKNKAKLDNLFGHFRVASVALAVQVVLWLLDLGIAL